MAAACPNPAPSEREDPDDLVELDALPSEEEPAAALFGFSYERALTLARRLGLASDGALRVCRVLAAEVGLHDGRGVASVAWIMDGVCASERSVQYWLREAQAAGLVVVEPCRCRRRGLAFRLTMRLFDLVREADGQLVLPTIEKGAAPAPQGGRPERFEVQGLHPLREVLRTSTSSARERAPAPAISNTNERPPSASAQPGQPAPLPASLSGALPAPAPSSSVVRSASARRTASVDRVERALAETQQIVDQLPSFIARAALLEADQAIDAYAAKKVACVPALIRRRVLLDALDAHQRRPRVADASPVRKDEERSEGDERVEPLDEATSRELARAAIAQMRANLAASAVTSSPTPKGSASVSRLPLARTSEALPDDDSGSDDEHRRHASAAGTSAGLVRIASTLASVLDVDDQDARDAANHAHRQPSHPPGRGPHRPAHDPRDEAASRPRRPTTLRRHVEETQMHQRFSPLI